MLGVMLFSFANTLAGQPPVFWRSPEHAIRFDGLSIYNQTNTKFEFFLGHGWWPYILTSAVYFTAAFLLVSVLPKRSALTLTFSFIFGHFYAGANWLAVRWHLGMQGEIMYAFVLAIMTTLMAFAVPERATFALKRLRWVAVAALLIDFACTLIGQPHSYWHHPETVLEANALSRMFLLHGWFAYVMYDAAYCLFILWLASALPRTTAFICMFAFVFGGFSGASNWFFYEWRMGIEAPLILALLFSIAVVMCTFSPVSDLEKSSGFEDAQTLSST